MEMLKGGIGVWLKRAKWAVALGLAADVAIIGGGCYGMYKFPQARLIVGEVFPPLQDAYYIYANKFSGKDKVLEDREADVRTAAEMFLQVAYAICLCVRYDMPVTDLADFTRQEWYGMQPVQEEAARAQGKSPMQQLANKFRGA